MDVGRRVIALSYGALLLGCASDPDASRVSAGDVHRFVDAWHRIAPQDRKCSALDAYFTAASPGLNAYSKKFGVGTKEVCAAVAQGGWRSWDARAGEWWGTRSTVTKGGRRPARLPCRHNERVRGLTAPCAS